MIVKKNVYTENVLKEEVENVEIKIEGLKEIVQKIWLSERSELE